MKATLTKNIRVESATAYLVFEKEQERKDIQKFLNGEEFEDDTINNRVKEYLRNLRIIDENHISTQKGDRIKRTGKMFVREEGKYKIWFVENDNFLGTKILYFERVAPRDNERVVSLKINFQEENYFLPIIVNEFSDLKLITKDKDGKEKEISGQVYSDTVMINLSWIWEGLEKSHYVFIGKIKDSQIKPHSINSDKNLNEYIFKIFPDWDKKQNRLKIQFNNISEESKITFGEKSYSSKWKDFDVKIENLPLMPNNTENALLWRDWLVEQELNRDYYLKYDFENLIKSINRKEGFIAYSNSLDIPEIENYRNKIFDKNRSKQSSAFWHLTAPNDLNPDISIKYSDKTLDYPVGQQITLSKITDELKWFSSHPVYFIIYYDKYVITEEQQKIMKAFFDCFDCQFKILITENLQQRSDFLQKNAPQIKQHYVNQIFINSKSQHNRYIILFENKQKYTIWQLPTSIDFFDLKNDKIKDSVSYNKVKIEMLKPELRTFIESKI